MTNAPPQTLNLEILHLQEKHQLSRFTCGEPQIDLWAQRTAFKLHSSNRHKVYVAKEVDSVSTVAFYSLSLNSQSSSKLLEQRDRDSWKQGAPFLYMDWLAVLRSMQGIGIGKLMLGHAMEQALELCQIAPVYGLALRSLNDRTTAFYTSLGFRIAPDEARAAIPLMILPIFSIQQLFGGR